MSDGLFAGPDQRPLFGAYVVPAPGDRESAVAAAEGMQHAGVDLAVTATSGPELSRYTNTNQALDIAASCQARAHLPVLASVTTWSRSVMALQAHLLGGHARGVTRLVCGNGNAPDDASARHGGRWAVDVVELIGLLAALNAGIDRHGFRLAQPTRFEVGVRIRAVPNWSDEDRARTRRKIDAGAQFIVTSPIYDPAVLESLLEVVDHDVPVLAAVHPLRSVAEAELLRGELAEGSISDDLVNRLRSADDIGAEAATVALEVAGQVGRMTDGVILTRSDDPLLAGRIRAALPRQGPT
jgi:homocysteine S-methyltransferase